MESFHRYHTYYAIINANKRPCVLQENLFDVSQKRHLHGACEGTLEAIKFCYCRFRRIPLEKGELYWKKDFPVKLTILKTYSTVYSVCLGTQLIFKRMIKSINQFRNGVCFA